jgi:DNA-binding CsgD family transcriptional regulator
MIGVTMRRSVAGGLLERTRELEAIRRASIAAKRGRGGVLLIEGQAGIGKTRLVAAARERLQRLGTRVLCARGSELERDFGFGVVRQLFEPVLNGNRRRRQRWLAGAAALAAPLFTTPDVVAAGREAQDSLLHGLFWLAANLSEQGMLALTVDDAHWADGPSLRFLGHLAHRIEGLPILLVIATRPAETQWRALIDAVAEEPVTEVLRPAPLSAEASANLVRESIPGADDLLCSKCHEASGGNPFLLGELIADLAERRIDPGANDVVPFAELVPESVRRSLLARLEPLPGAAARVARAAAVLERGRVREVAALGDVALDEAARACDELVAIGVLGSVEPVEFAHPLVRAAAYADIPNAQRSLAHLQAAKLIAERGGTNEDVAAHLMRAEPSGDPWVIDVLLAAADKAGTSGAPETRASYLRRAVEEPLEPGRRLELQLELGRAELAAGSREGVAHLQAVLDGEVAPALRADAALEIARALTMAGETRQAAELLAAKVDELHPVSREDTKRLAAELIMVTDVDLNAASFVADRLDSADELARGGPMTPAMRAHEAVMLLENGESAELATTAANRALAGDLLFELGMAGSQYFFLTAFVLVCADRVDEAIRHHDRAIAEARARGLAAPFVIGSAQRAYAQVRAGALEEAEADANSTLEVARLNGWLPLELMGLLPLVLTLTERDPPAALELVARAESVLERIEHAQAAVLLIARGKLRMQLGDAEDAARDLLEGGGRFVDWGVTNPGAFDWRTSAAEALSALGDRDGAFELAREELDLARRWGTPRAIGIALRGQGLVQGGANGVDLLRQSVAMLERSQARLEQARALVELGAALRRQNHRADAREPLRTGLDLARQCGATILAERAMSELVAAGARPRRQRLAGVEALTPTERRIARLAVEGRSNPEIAQGLFVTRKTVEFHLSNAYRKLDIHSREDLAEALRSETKN